MAAIAGSTADGQPQVVVWLPLAGLLAAVGIVDAECPAWMLMWILAASIYVGLKWLTFADCPAAWQASPRRVFGYLLLWPGMNAGAFFSASRRVSRPGVREWWFAVAKLAFGLLLFGGASLVSEQSHLLAGWLGVAGIVFVLHFGVFHLLSLGWRRIGVDAPPIMDVPLRSSSLAEFWGRRWNRAFRDVGHAYVFRPLVPRLGAAGAMLAVFTVSGLVHDLVISIPAGAGWGLPTLYFVFQGAGALAERTRPGRRLGLGRGITGRLFCGAAVIAPLGLLFHQPFMERVVVPMLAALGVA